MSSPRRAAGQDNKEPCFRARQRNKERQRCSEEHRSQPAGAPRAVLRSPVPSWGHHGRKAGLSFAFFGEKKEKREKKSQPQTETM